MNSLEGKTYTLIGRDGNAYQSAVKGTLGGYRRGIMRIYGRLDCKNALSWIARGHYVSFRVFFADEGTAVAAGFRPCGKCMTSAYQSWRTLRKAGSGQNAQNG